jgi:NCAIR mutase (PurE)-related protein
MELRDLLERFKKGDMSLDDAVGELRLLSFERVGEVAKLDPHREARCGIPEVILGDGKSPDDLEVLAETMLSRGGRAIISRVSEEQRGRLEHLPGFTWHEKPRLVVLRQSPPLDCGGRVGVITAGTSDIPPAEEARVIAAEMGCKTRTVYDVGISGIHRLFPELGDMLKWGPDALVVAAGREGTLPSVVAGLCDVPIIGLPVSVGYGEGGGGKAALYSMLQSCSVLALVNIDNGMGAGAFAALIAARAASARRKSSDGVGDDSN